MQEISFKDIPKSYELIRKQIKSKILNDIYSNFQFLYFNVTEVMDVKDKEEFFQTNCNFSVFLSNFLKDFQFITFNFHNIIIKSEKDSNDDRKLFFSTTNIVVCIENKCIIIDQISNSEINKIIQNLRKDGISILNVGTKKSIIIEENQSYEEVNNFCLYFLDEINSNKFVEITIKSIAGFLIRRYFYPSCYFKNPSFFTFYKTKETEIKSKIDNYLFKTNLNNYIDNIDEFKSEIVDDIKEEISNFKQFKIKDFQENDFIFLRTIYANEKAILKLIIHIESLYVFMLKKLNTQDITEEKDIQREIEFCTNHSHRSLMKFYGFMRNKKNIVGFVYEFMCNGSITYSNKINSLIAINRIFQGIDYIHSKSLIYRDCKPSNILLDHDGLPYISDFETIRHLTYENDDIFTNNIGSILYTSPEQDQGQNLSYSTDIYSFGLLVYFINEGKNLMPIRYKNDPSYKEKLNDKIQLLNNPSSNIEKLIEGCIKYFPNDRLTNDQIKFLIKDELMQFQHLEDNLIKTKGNIDKKQIIQFFYENIISCINDDEFLGKCFENIYIYQLFFIIITSDDFPIALNNIGSCYFDQIRVKYNPSKAQYYFEKSAQFNYPVAFFNLGNLYRLIIHGTDYAKSRHYFELAAQYNYPQAFDLLGYIYYNGEGVKVDYEKAKEYYELAAKFNHESALFSLGELYYFGFGVKKDYSKAKKYYELSANLGYECAFNKLGILYREGEGVERDFLKAKEYFEIAIEYDFTVAYSNLGNLYINGQGVCKDISRAKYYFEIAAKRNDPYALLSLGDLYYNGQGVEKNYIKAIGYYELAGNQGLLKGYYNAGNIFYNGYGVKKII